MSNVLVTGGAGYIGSHMCVELLQNGDDVVVIDNLSNSSTASLEAVQRITQRELEFVDGDVTDADVLGLLFADHRFDAVVHFAGLKSVGESVDDPIKYYHNNVNGTLCLVEAMSAAEVKTIVFSSSATVYGIPSKVPITEDFPTGAINPYGRTKLVIERLLEDVYEADPSWRISILRYFNPVGAHPSGEIGEDPNDAPNNLMPYVSQVAVGRLPYLKVFGDNYPTRDGTGVRDYIHVVDLIDGHMKALEFLEDAPKLAVHNLGTGTGYSVLEVLDAFQSACGKTLRHEIVGRRPGDAAESYADPSKAVSELGWQAKFDLARMCEDAWRWQSLHPNGYSSEGSAD
ncbi:MAG: UDP-glucose 4-epimerase GalE [Gammaproteobacteria bacterium]|nr:UDP-glucose 4-epimerase GalE [Gammaproteobacteria bacterium]